MKCITCGVELNEEQNFCPICGTKIEIESAERTCPSCGEALKVDARFCPRCGKQLGGDSMDGKTVTIQTKADFKLERLESIDWTDSAILKTYVKKRENYYSREFKKIQSGEKSKFNWAAFLIGPILCIYRKNFSLFFRLYLAPIIVLVIGIPIFVAYQTISILGGNVGGLIWVPIAIIIGLIFSICVCVVGGYRFNHYYYLKIKKMVDRDTVGNDDIKKQSGVSLLFVIVFIILSGIVSFAVQSVTSSILIDKLIAVERSTESNEYSAEAFSMQATVPDTNNTRKEVDRSDQREGQPASVMSVDDVFGTGTDEWSWHSASTGYYMIPFYDSYSDTYNIWFTSANDTIWADTAYTVEIAEIEQTPNGGLVCRGDMYEAAKESPAYNGTIEVTWDSMESIDFPKMQMVDGHQMTNVDMIADDYGYYGLVDSSIEY